jgi:peptidoglycan/LPS O-acetylase OafA/YrhL
MAPAPWAPPLWSAPTAPERGGFRLDIEGLRAVAVLLVLAYHADFWPFRAGYVGVDVFFVVSGFLITSLLVGELRRTGFIMLRRFWARRARRLLPASSLTIVATLVAGYLVLDPLSVVDLAHDALAAAAFAINIVFAHRQSDYLTSDAAPSPLLHFWSLALEEQFYLVWPVLLQVVAGYRRRPLPLVATIVAVLWPLSFYACVALTDSNQPWAFYSLPTRAWELLTGAGLALLAASIARVPAWLRGVVGWAGLVTIVAAAVAFDAATPFPGPAAFLPVIATAAVIAAGPTAPLGPMALLRHRSLTWIGARSYSIYLWHWPALVLVAAQFGPLSVSARLATLAGAVVLAAVTFRLLEDPVRHSVWLAAKARRGLVMGGGLIAVAACVSLLIVDTAPALVGAGAAAAPAVVTAPAAPATTVAMSVPPTAVRVPASSAGVAPAPASPPTTSPPPATMTPATTAPAPTAPTSPPTTPRQGPDQLAAANAPELDAGVGTEAAPANLRPSVRGAHGDVPGVDHDGCNLDATVTTPGPCTFGDPASPVSVVLFGDSHAAQWFPALDAVATQHHWKLEVLTKKGCPSADIPVFSTMVNRELRECEAWRVNVAARVGAEHPTVMIMSSFRYRRQMGEWAGVEPNEAWRQGLTKTLDTFVPLVSKVLVLGDTPTPAGDVPSCVAAHLTHVSSCAAARSDAVRDDRLQVERDVAAGHGAAFTSTSDWLCAPTACPVIVGDVLVYRDSNHITATAAEWLAPYIEVTVGPLVGA